MVAGLRSLGWCHLPMALGMDTLGMDTDSQWHSVASEHSMQRLSLVPGTDSRKCVTAGLHAVRDHTAMNAQFSFSHSFITHILNLY